MLCPVSWHDITLPLLTPFVSIAHILIRHKGLCLHQCKLPAQQFFKDELGLSLTVSPNFESQECQWSFGEEPLPPQDDPSFPKGCLVGCESRKQVAEMGLKSDICSV